MVKLRSTLSSLLIIVAFCALTVLASFNYNYSPEQKEKLAENAWYQKAAQTFNTVFGAAQFLADANLSRNLGWGEKIKERVADVNLQDISLADFKPKLSEETSTDDSNSKQPELTAEVSTGVVMIDQSEGAALETASVAPETNTPTTAENEQTTTSKNEVWTDLKDRLKKEWQSQGENEVDTNLQKLINYQRTDSGAEIIFTLKNGVEHKINLPFKFLSR